MRVLVPELSGFCPGVKSAENRILEEISKQTESRHSVLGMMINNRKYIKHLSSMGVFTSEEPSEIPEGSTVFIRTHGIDCKIESELKNNFNLIDLTCRNVKSVQKIIGKYSDMGAAIIITGKKTHPEVIGLRSYGRHTAVLENDEDLNNFIANPEINGKPFNHDDFTELFITSQTTGSLTFFNETIKRIKSKWPEAIVKSFNSICPVTKKKEVEALKLQKNADISFVIGDPLSSNAGKLFKSLKGADERTFFIQDLAELKARKLNFSKLKKALVVSSASTPDFVEEEIIKYLESQ